jgi:hypothetical protein
MSGVWQRSDGEVLGHRQTKEAATDNPNLMSPRHIPTLPTRWDPVTPAIGRLR